MTEKMAIDFKQAIDSLKTGSKPRAIILTGAGGAFSAGGDLEMLLQKTKISPDENYKRMQNFYGSFLGFRALKIPVIAAINGVAVGAGLCVACAAQIRIASTKAKLGFTFTKLGLHPGMAATHFLPKVLGSAMAYELMLTGRIISAEEALCIGLISKLTEERDLMESALSIAREITATGPEVTAQLMETIYLHDEDEFRKALHREASCQSINYGNPEFLEGILAAREKRKANF